MLHAKIVDTKEKKLSIIEAENFISSHDYGASIFFTGTVRNQNDNKSEALTSSDRRNNSNFFIICYFIIVANYIIT